MSKKPNHGQSLALRAAAAAAASYDSDDEAQPSPEPPSAVEMHEGVGPSESTAIPGTDVTDEEQDDASAAPARPRGRPKGKRETRARQTVHLDEARHNALVRLAQDQGTSVHSLILAGIDHVIGKPKIKGWSGSAE